MKDDKGGRAGKGNDGLMAMGSSEWQSVFEAMPQPIVVLNPHYIIMAANRAAERALGVEAGEVLGRRCHELFHGSDCAPAGCPMERLLREGSSDTVEMEVEALHRSFLVSCTPLRDESGRVTRIVHLATDITDLKRTRQALEESRESFKSHFAQVSDVVFSVDSELRVVSVSPSVERSLGYRPEELVGRIVSELPIMDLETAGDSATNLARVLAGERVPVKEYVFIARDGTKRYGEVARTPLQRGDGQVVGLISVTRDVTERRQAEHAVREIEARYRDLMNQLPETTAELDEKGFITFVNLSGLASFGFTEEDVKAGVHVFRTVAPECRERVRVSMAMLLKGELPGAGEYTMVRKDDSVFPAIVHSAPLWRDGRVAGMRTIVVDITERKRAEEALMESEERYRSLFENAPVGIFQSTPGGRYLSVNPAYARIHGFSSPEVMMAAVKDIGSVIYANPNDRSEYMRMLDEGQEVHGFEVDVLSRDGRRVPLSMSVRAIRDEEGNVRYYEGMVEDISERKAAEEVLKRREKELEAKSLDLQEAGTALRVLLREKERHERDMEDSILGNVRDLILPYMGKLKTGSLGERERTLVSVIEAGLKDAVSPFLRKLTAVYAQFTPTEIQVADLVRAGKSTKEIADALNVGTGTVDTHRKAIRNKLGLNNQKINLTTYLRSLE